MRRILLSLLLLLGAVALQAQQRTTFFNIKGQPVTAEYSEAVLIYYSPAYCHQCMEDLVRLSRRWAKAKAGRHIFVMVKGADISGMRSDATQVKTFFDNALEAEIVFDLNPLQKERYSQKYAIVECPVLFYLDSQGHTSYYPYKSMFATTKRLRQLPFEKR